MMSTMKNNPIVESCLFISMFTMVVLNINTKEINYSNVKYNE